MFNASVMIIACPACATRYAVPDTAIGVDGRTVRCAKCRHSWFQDGPGLPDRPAPAPAPPAATVSSAPMPVEAPAAAAEPPPPVAPAPVAPAPAEPLAEQPADDAAADVAASQTQSVEAGAEEASSEGAAEAGDDFAAEAPPPLPPLAQTARSAPVYSDLPGDRAFDHARSTFEHEPPFRPRVNRTRMWTIAAVVFAIVSFAAVGAVAWYGLPDWMPLSRTTFARSEPDLVLDFPPGKQDRRTLPNGTEFFGASGSVTNVGATRQTVPTILIVLRDAKERIVYSWEVVPPKRSLAPGEAITINEAVTDVPKSAKFAEIGWKRD